MFTSVPLRPLQVRAFMACADSGRLKPLFVTASSDTQCRIKNGRRITTRQPPEYNFPYGIGLGDGVGGVTPVPGLLAGTPAPGMHGLATVDDTLPELPAFVLPGGVVDPAEFVVEPA